MCSTSEAGKEQNGKDVAFSEINSIPPAIAVGCNPPTIDAGVQQKEEPGFPGLFPGVTGGRVVNGKARSRYYQSQSATILLREVFEQNRRILLDPTHTAKTLSGN